LPHSCTERGELLIEKIEEIYIEELIDPIFRKNMFSGTGTLISEYFIRDKLSRMHPNKFIRLNEDLEYPKTEEE
jgi:hypothetical protein